MYAMKFLHSSQRRLSAGLKAVIRMLHDNVVTRKRGYRPMQRTHVGATPFALQTCNTPLSASSIKPLRVLCVREPGQQRSSVGRMVISGRMADVCAELDRLAAREAAMS